MYKHHEETIKNITDKLKQREDILAVIVGGSIAHGFENESSDVDLMIAVSDDDYKKRFNTGDIQHYETEACTYEGGYIDGKYICVDFLKRVMEKGSEPARFAFKDAFVTYSKIDGLEDIIRNICRYQKEQKENNIIRFYAQFEAWKWYCSEALKRNNRYLLNHSVSNLVIFGGRLILAHNETLYPYHKWFLKVLENVKEKPENLIDAINSCLENPCEETIEVLYLSIKDFTQWKTSGKGWPNQFMIDSELNWMYGDVPVADI